MVLIVPNLIKISLPHRTYQLWWSASASRLSFSHDRPPLLDANILFLPLEV
jgi:hypothetical protein